MPNTGFDGLGALILGSATATHTVTFQNPIEFNNGDTRTTRTILVPDGPAAKEAIIPGGLSLNGLPGTPDIFLELNVTGALDLTGEISGEITLYKFGPGMVTLTGANTFVGDTIIDEGTVNVNSDAALGNPLNEVLIQNGSTLQAGGDITSNRTFVVQFGDPGGIIDTNGHDVTLASGSAVFGEILEKQGAGTLTLSGGQDYEVLTTSGGTTNVNSMLGGGSSIVNANATTNFGASQTLAALNIGEGVEVTFGDGLTLTSGPGKSGVSAMVPEAGSMGLLLTGALGFLGRRRRSGCQE